MRLKTNGLTGDLDAYTRLSPKLKMGTIEDEFSRKTSLSSPQSRQGVPEMDVAGQVKTGSPTMYTQLRKFTLSNLPIFEEVVSQDV